jgi:hypothetical protein
VFENKVELSIFQKHRQVLKRTKLGSHRYRGYGESFKTKMHLSILYNETESWKSGYYFHAI